MLKFIFDVESIGLNGEAFAFGIHVLNEKWEVVDEKLHHFDPDLASGTRADRLWVADNIPPIDQERWWTHTEPRFLIKAFQEIWKYYKSRAIMYCESPVPVESNFLRACGINPYPLYDISSIMLADGLDPMKTYERLPDELPVHNPLADCRQSARLLRECLERLKNERAIK